MESTASIKPNLLREEIQQLAEKFMETYKLGDPKKMAAFYTESAIAMPPNSDFVKGKQQIEAMWENLMNLGIKNLNLQILEVEEKDDLAYEMGQVTLLGEDDKILDDAKYLVIWKHENGAWKIHRDIFNSNLARQ